ncbi:MAG: hypothetical protein NWP50_01785, partial [Schleiferiaceae bacterium]|jgi:uncharacterized protein HemX|nr:hypothetical protein [Schleiferiaceae bacterium]
MRYVALLSVFFLVSACLVPKKDLLFAQTQVVRLQSDSLAFEQRLLTAQGTMGNTQGQLEELQKSYEEIWNQLDNAEATLQVVSRELDSLQLRHKEVSVSRDVWRIEALRAKRRMERAEFVRDSVSTVLLNYKSSASKPKK